MNRQEILQFINDIIETEHGTAVTEDDFLTDANIDSFATVMLFLELEGNFNAFPKKKFSSLNFHKLTIKEIIDEVEKSIDASS
jgi:hypothetical protein